MNVEGGRGLDTPWGLAFYSSIESEHTRERVMRSSASTISEKSSFSVTVERKEGVLRAQMRDHDKNRLDLVNLFFHASLPKSVPDVYVAYGIPAGDS